MKILLIEDEKYTASTIKEQLEDFFIVDVSYTGEEGLDLAETNKYDLIILDLILPDVNGIEICKILREEKVDTPILVLTGQFDTQSKVQALDCGADDYLIKPFSMEELLARIRALLRRPQQMADSNIVSIGNLTIDLRKHQVMRGNKAIHLRRKELYLLEYLVRNVGRVITRSMILDHVWEHDDEPTTNTVDVHIKYLRDRIDKPFSKKLIKTVYGLGYKIES